MRLAQPAYLCRSWRPFREVAVHRDATCVRLDLTRGFWSRFRESTRHSEMWTSSRGCWTSVRWRNVCASRSDTCVGWSQSAGFRTSRSAASCASIPPTSPTGFDRSSRTAAFAVAPGPYDRRRSSTRAITGPAPDRAAEAPRHVDRHGSRTMSRRRTFGTIRTLSSGRYQARYTSPDGVRHRAPRSFATKAEASQWLAKIETEFARGTWTDPDAASRRARRLRAGLGRARANLRPRTVDLYESSARAPHRPRARRSRGRHAHAGDCPSLVLAAGSTSGPGSLTPAKSYRLLRTILNTAVADGLIARTRARSSVPASSTAPSAPSRRSRKCGHSPTRSRRTFVRSCSRPRSPVSASASSPALTRDCVDLDAGTITVAQALVERDDGSLSIGPPKSEAGRRTFAVPAVLLPELAAPPRPVRRPPATTRSSSSVPRARGYADRTGRSSGKQATKKVGVEGLRLHDLRHTCNTLTAATGASTRELMHRMGHASARAACATSTQRVTATK